MKTKRTFFDFIFILVFGVFFFLSSCTSSSSEIIDKHSYEEHDHQWDDGIILKTPTCLESGIMEYDCKLCSHTKVEVLAPYGHDYQESIILPTCQSKGYTTYKCKRCDETKIDNYVK